MTVRPQGQAGVPVLHNSSLERRKFRPRVRCSTRQVVSFLEAQRRISKYDVPSHERRILRSFATAQDDGMRGVRAISSSPAHCAGQPLMTFAARHSRGAQSVIPSRPGRLRWLPKPSARCTNLAGLSERNDINVIGRVSRGIWARARRVARRAQPAQILDSASNDTPSSALRAPSPRKRGEGQQPIPVAPRPACGERVARSAG